MERLARREGAEVMDEMRGCPFCGGPVEVWDTSFGVVSVVECKACHVRFVLPWFRKGTELFEFWNKRAGDGEALHEC